MATTEAHIIDQHIKVMTTTSHGTIGIKQLMEVLNPQHKRSSQLIIQEANSFKIS
jgi:hypothetical protein